LFTAANPSASTLYHLPSWFFTLWHAACNSDLRNEAIIASTKQIKKLEEIIIMKNINQREGILIVGITVENTNQRNGILIVGITVENTNQRNGILIVG
jgi:hypothetical protein